MGQVDEQARNKILEQIRNRAKKPFSDKENKTEALPVKKIEDLDDDLLADLADAVGGDVLSDDLLADLADAVGEDALNDDLLADLVDAVREEEAEEEAEPPPPPPPPIIHIIVSADKMLAFLKIETFADDQVVTTSEVLEKLEQMKIVYGIDMEAVDNYCKYEQYYKEIKIVHGVKPIRGEDGYYKLNFKTEIVREPLELPDGRLDYKNFDIIQNIDKGTNLCDITYATQGIDGTNILGENVPSKPGKNPTIPVGKNCRLSEDKSHILSVVDGAVEFVGGKIMVDETYTVRGDVGPITGNIEFKGNVIVSGNLLEGFQIKADKNVTIKGYVEGAKIISGENVIINMGINGMYKGVVEAEGDITTKYIENGTAICGGTFRSGVALNSTVKARDSIVIKGKKGAIINGKFLAAKVIYAKEIGTEIINSAVLTIEDKWYEKEGATGSSSIMDINDRKEKSILTKAEAKSMVTNLEQNFQLIVNKLQSFSESDDSELSSKERLDKVNMKKKLLLSKSQVSASLKQAIEKLNELEASEDTSNMKLICVGTLHAGARINIGYATVKIEQAFTNTKFFIDKGGMVTGPVLPHERDIK